MVIVFIGLLGISQYKIREYTHFSDVHVLYVPSCLMGAARRAEFNIDIQAVTSSDVAKMLIRYEFTFHHCSVSAS